MCEWNRINVLLLRPQIGLRLGLQLFELVQLMVHLIVVVPIRLRLHLVSCD